MNLIVMTMIVVIHSSLASPIGHNKTKRTIAPHVTNYENHRMPVLLYTDNSGSGSAFYTPVKPVFEPKQVAAQQVLYEFQQTPTNAVSNVHVNQFYQPVGVKPSEPTDPSMINSAETVANPVQHSSLIRHGQNYAQVQFQPLPLGPPQHIQTQQYVPGKYLYVNGKILYQPNQQAPAQPPPQAVRPVNYNFNYQQQQQPPVLAPRLTPPPAVNYRRFNPPQPHQMQSITKPMGAEVTEEQNEEEPAEENAEVNEEADDGEENEEKPAYEDDEEEHFGRYRFDDDDEDHEAYREDDDEDSERGYSKHVPKKKTKPHKYSKGKNYKFSENYSTSSKYDKPRKLKKVKAPKMQYKAVKYSKQVNGHKPRMERIEGRQSENIPVVHKQKIFKEKWYVTKSMDNSK